jgi:S1-C subfamily serine protease
VRKAVEDLKKYGEVQRAMLGVSIQGVNAEVAEKYKLDKIEGIYIAEVTDNGAAREAGIRSGDVILNIQGKTVNSNAELQEVLSQYRPGDVINLTVKRNNSEKLFTVKLRNMLGETGIIHDTNSVLGSEFAAVSDHEKSQLEINRGIKITKLGNGKLKQAGLVEGFIITDINKKPVYEVNDLKKVIASAKGGILVEGIYPNGEIAYFVFGVN